MFLDSPVWKINPQWEKTVGIPVIRAKEERMEAIATTKKEMANDLGNAMVIIIGTIATLLKKRNSSLGTGPRNCKPMKRTP